jgi:hypothetical protein
MMTSSAIILMCSTMLMGADADSDRIINQVREYCERITSVHLRGVERPTKSGGLWSDDPAAARPGYDTSFERRYDIWIDPPRYRSVKTEIKMPANGRQKSSTLAIYFDGTTYTYLDMHNRTGLVMKGGSVLKPPSYGPLHAIGYCFFNTYHSSLAALLTDSSKVDVERLVVDGRTEWLLQVKSLPDNLQPQGWSEKIRHNILVRIWVSIDPEVQILRWAAFVPRSGNAKSDSGYGRSIPTLRLEGHNLLYGFVNCDLKPATDQLRGRSILMPRRILHGNGNATRETLLQEITINTKYSASTFLPPIPHGFTITRPNDGGESNVSLSGGAPGSAIRVLEITKQAKEMLASGDSLRASPDGPWAWVIPIGCSALAFGGAGILVFVRSRRNS